MKKIAFFLLFWVCINQAFAQNNGFPINAKQKFQKAWFNQTALQLLNKAKMLNQKQEIINQKPSKATVFHMDSVIAMEGSNDDLYVYYYDSLNRLEKEDMYLLFSGNKFHYSFLDFHYDTNNNIIKKVIWAINTSYLFDTIMYIDYAYDTNNYIQEEVWHERDDSTGQMYLLGKLEYACDSLGNTSEIIIHDWDTINGNWKFNEKYNYTYNSSSQLTEYIEQSWDTLSNTWELLSKYESLYDVQGNKTENIEYRYTGTAWENAYKEAYTHNGQNLLIEQNRHVWDNIGSLWLPSKSKYIYQYNNNESIGQSEYYRWIDSTLSWGIDSRFIYTRNENYTAQDIILPYHSYLFSFRFSSVYYPHPYHNMDVISVIFNDMLLSEESQRWNSASGVWNPSYNVRNYYYSDHTASIAQDEKKSISVFPNPASDWLSFKINDNANALRFSLFDISGRKIMDVQPTTSTISLENINSGMYLYRIETEEGFFSGKISVIR